MNEHTTPEAALKKHGKTFYFAQRILSKQNGPAVARLYRFCRYIDDLADESSDPQQTTIELQKIRSELAGGQSEQIIVQDFIKLAKEWPIELKNADDLIAGAILDLSVAQIQNEAELIRYCYRVAGTVGQMMCPLLFARKVGIPFAIDLGIAMQLTNIARDILHDAKLGRRYIPAAWVNDLSADEISLLREEDLYLLQNSVQRLLTLADSYYASARHGFVHLPYRSRLCIAIAAQTYREIGVKLRKRSCNFWEDRVYTTLLEKTWLAFLEIIKTTVTMGKGSAVSHDPELHKHIAHFFIDKNAGKPVAPNSI